jgi:hypothetical protein
MAVTTALWPTPFSAEGERPPEPPGRLSGLPPDRASGPVRSGAQGPLPLLHAQGSLPLPRVYSPFARRRLRGPMAVPSDTSVASSEAAVDADSARRR